MRTVGGLGGIILPASLALARVGSGGRGKKCLLIALHHATSSGDLPLRESGSFSGLLFRQAGGSSANLTAGIILPRIYKCKGERLQW